MSALYVLTLNVAGPGFVDRIEISSDDPAALLPQVSPDDSGIVWERYYTNEEENKYSYAEIRQEYIVMRQMHTIETPDRTETEMGPGPEFPFDPRRGGIRLNRDGGGDA